MSRHYFNKITRYIVFLCIVSIMLLMCVSTTSADVCYAAENESSGAADTSDAGDGSDESGAYINWPSGPEISASAGIVMEASTGSILYEKDIYGKYYPASTTKILTSLVALENSELNEVVTVSYAAENYVSKSSSRMGLVEGEQLSMEEALYGIMLESANEATYAVGEHVAGSIAKFIKLMNRKVTQLGLTHSHFANSHGLHDDNHYTCCYDLAVISKAAFQNAIFRKITGTSTYAMPATNKNPARLLTNHHYFINKTMKYDYCIGGKTGATTQAGYALVTYAKKDGMTLISVVMHADTWNDVYRDTKTLLDFAYDNYTLYDMEEASGSGEDIFPSLFDGSDEFLAESDGLINTSDAGNIILPNGIDCEDTLKTVTLDKDIELEHGDNVIGSINYMYGDRLVGSADIIYYNDAYPLTERSFNARWPRFMKPVSVVFPEADEDAADEESNLAGENSAGEDSIAKSDGEDDGTGTDASKKHDENDIAEAEGTESEGFDPAIFIKDNLPLVIGGGIGLVVLLIGIIIIAAKTRRRRRRR